MQYSPLEWSKDLIDSLGGCGMAWEGMRHGVLNSQRAGVTEDGRSLATFNETFHQTTIATITILEWSTDLLFFLLS